MRTRTHSFFSQLNNGNALRSALRQAAIPLSRFVMLGVFWCLKLNGITMAGEVEGSVRSAKFDGDGMALNSIRLVESGKAANYFGSNRYGQYLGETPTGDLRCLCADPGTASAGDFANGPYLEVVSMSGLQVDFYNDYIGGEVRLAYYHDGGKITPVTGISISGSLTEVLNHIRLSSTTTVYNGYCGPEKAILDCMKIF